MDRINEVLKKLSNCLRIAEKVKDKFTREFMKIFENVNRKSGECLEKARNVSLLPWRN